VPRILLDTDLAMGASGSDIDDGFALALALADPDIEVDAITTVGGNSDVVTSTRLTRELLDQLDRPDIAVHQGAGQPIAARWRRPSEQEPSLPVPGSRSQTAVDELVRRVIAAPGELTVVAIGPLTNVALACLQEPLFARAVREIVVMGGVYLEHTNVAGMPGEYNFWCDPDAAQAMLASGASIRLVGLDVTNQVRLTHDDTAGMAKQAEAGKVFAPFAARCADEWIEHQQRVKVHDEREHDSCALHDPLAVAAVSRPELITWTPAQVTVETTSPVTRGVAVADLLRWQNPPPANCRIATAVDADAFRRYFFEQIAGLP
jgi:purine nucleosidase